MSGVAPRQSPPLGHVAPFFVAAPLGLIAAGLMLVRADGDAFLAVNIPKLVSATHAAVLGWLTLFIMGALYQLGPTVFGGRLLSLRLVRVQFVVHVMSVAAFVIALETWNVSVMGMAGIAVAVSFGLFLVNALPAIRWFKKGSLPRLYVSVAVLFLVGTAAAGISFAGALEHLWFPVTQGRLAGHAHLGLVGWLGLTLMGVSYQLVPMFHVVPRRRPRFGRIALAVTVVSTIAAGIGFSLEPSIPVRLALALFLAAGPVLWASDMVEFLRARSRRRMDIHGRATILALAFLVLAIALGMLVSLGGAVAPAGEPARLQLAYGVAAIGGWAGVTLIGNSFKIVPFLVWNERYREIAGREPVPMVAELSNETWAHVTLTLHAMAVLVLVLGAISGQLLLLHSGGFLLMVAGASHFGAIVFVLLHRPAVAAGAPTRPGPVRS